MAQYGAIDPLVMMAVLTLVGCAGLVGRAGPKTAVILQVDPHSPLPADTQKRKELMEQTRQILARRIASCNVTYPAISIKGNNKIVVTAYGKDVAKAVSKITSTGTMNLYHLKGVAIDNHPTSYWKMTISEGKRGEKDFVFTGKHGETISSLTQPQEILTKVIDVTHNHPILTSANLLATTQADLDLEDGVIIRVELDEDGKQLFHRFASANKQEIIAVVYDGKMLAALRIIDAVPTEKIQIPGFTEIAQAKQAADTLNAGELPIKLIVANNSKP